MNRPTRPEAIEDPRVDIGSPAHGRSVPEVVGHLLHRSCYGALSGGHGACLSGYGHGYGGQYGGAPGAKVLRAEVTLHRFLEELVDVLGLDVDPTSVALVGEELIA